MVRSRVGTDRPLSHVQAVHAQGMSRASGWRAGSAGESSALRVLVVVDVRRLHHARRAVSPHVTAWARARRRDRHRRDPLGRDPLGRDRLRRDRLRLDRLRLHRRPLHAPARPAPARPTPARPTPARPTPGSTDDRLDRLRVHHPRLGLNGDRHIGLGLDRLRLDRLRVNGLRLNGLRLNGLRLNGLRRDRLRPWLWLWRLDVRRLFWLPLGGLDVSCLLRRRLR